jgi:hypothetical protein
MEIENRQLLVIEFVVCLVAWSGIAVAFFGPRLAATEPRRALRILVAPQMFRIIGMTLLAKNVVGPGLDRDFATWVAIGDALTSTLAIVTFFALGRPGRAGLYLASLTTAVGLVDMVRNLAGGIRTNAANDLGAGWFVVAVVVPLMLVAHVAAARRLIRAELWTARPRGDA